MAVFTYGEMPRREPVKPAPPLRPAPPRARSRGALKLSVVIACYGQRALTAACLDTLQADALDAQVIVVDNASPDDTKELLRGRAGIKALYLTENRGCAGGWNRGLQEATGDVLCVLNNDTLLHPGGLRQLAAGAWEQGVSCWHGGRLNPDFTFLGYTRDPAALDFADGCALAFRRDVWEAVGTFDEGFAPAYCEDSDWSFRARLLGYGFGIFPDTLTHLGQMTSKGMGLSAIHARSQDRLRLKWAGKGVGERMVVRRWAALGDVVMTTPALAALRRQKPLARLHLQTHPRCAELLAGLSLVDSVGDAPPWEPTAVFDLDGAYELQDRAGVWPHPALAYAAVLGVPIHGERYTLPETSDLTAWAKEAVRV